MMNILKYIIDKAIHSFIFGAVYYLLESFYKGYWTNWRMFFLASVIGVLIGCINELFSYETDFLLQCIVGTLIALLCECVFGIRWNIEQGLAIWNYTTLPLSFCMGQINLFFGVIWLILSGICVVLDDALHYYICDKTVQSIRPTYQILNTYYFQLPEKA